MNIEKTISEHAVADILTPMLESQDRIVTEDVAPLFDAATGLDTPPASGSVTTTIEESRSVITAIIRKAWTATLTMLGGASVIGYIAAAYTYLRTRLQGNETYGIPDRRSEISASSPLAANLALLNDRKIGGVPEAVDGIPLVRLACNSATAATVTELTDDTDWGTATHANIASLLNLFPNLKKFAANCIGEVSAGLFSNRANLEEITMPKITKLRRYNSGASAIVNCAALKKVDMESVNEVYADGAPDYPCIHNCPNLEYVRLGTITVRLANLLWAASSAKLLHMEIGEGSNVSMNFSGWTPDSETLAHQDFLPNFKTYIANRLKGGYPIGQGPILTLSQAVRNAIHAAESTYGIENIIITQKGWTISPAPN